MLEGLTRVFRIGALELQDPAPQLGPNEALALHAAAYPFVSTCSFVGSQVEAGRLVVTYERPAAATKG